MAFCKCCGRQLAEGEQCFCKAVPVIPQGNPVPAPVPVSAPKPKRKKTGIIIAAAAFLLAVGGALLWFFVLRDSYDKPLKQYFRGLNRKDYKKCADAVITDYWYQYTAEKYNDGDVDALKDEVDEMWGEELADYYADAEDYSFSYEIIRKKKFDEDELDEIEDRWEDFYPPGDLKEGYKLKVRVTVSGDGRAESDTGYYTVVRSDSEGWRLLSNSCKEFSFERYDDAHGLMVDVIDFH